MALGDYRIVPGLVTEEIGQEILVCDTDLAVVHRVSGPAADLLRQVLATGGAPAALQDDDITAGLVAAGVLVAADAPAELVSRRSFVGAAAAVGAFGIVTLALPRAAAASSGDETTPPPEPTVSTVADPNRTQIQYPSDDGNFTLGRDVENIDVRWREASENPSPFSWRVTVTPTDGATFAAVTSETFAAGPAYRTVYVPGWLAGERATVTFFSVDLDPSVVFVASTFPRRP
jgi:hypothetical protein